MNKTTVLQTIKQALADGTITGSDLLVFTKKTTAPIEKHFRFNINSALYSIGALITVVGAIALTAQLWDDIGTIGHIAITLVLGLLIAGIGSMLMIQKKQTIGAVFHVIGGALLPFGTVVTVQELAGYNTSIWTYVLAFAVLTGFYLSLVFHHRHAVLTFFAIGNTTTTIYLLTDALLERQTALSGDTIFAYLTVVIGVCYLLLAHRFKQTWNEAIVPLLHFFGANFVTWATFARLVDGENMWIVLYVPLMLFGMFVASKLKSVAIQVVCTIGLLAYIVYITGEYFADSIGWPVSLIFLGFICIGLGYGSVQYTKKWVK